MRSASAVASWRGSTGGRTAPTHHAAAPTGARPRSAARHRLRRSEGALRPRDVIARVVDGSAFDEFKPLYGTSLVTGWASIHGFPVGILANARGILFSEEAEKGSAVHPTGKSDRHPLIFLQNTTGFMVGAEYEQGGIIKDGAKMINAVSNSTVPT